jgi:hypothetical protein
VACDAEPDPWVTPVVDGVQLPESLLLVSLFAVVVVVSAEAPDWAATAASPTEPSRAAPAIADVTATTRRRPVARK